MQNFNDHVMDNKQIYKSISNNPSEWPTLPFNKNNSKTPVEDIPAKTLQLMYFAAKSVQAGDRLVYANKLNSYLKTQHACSIQSHLLHSSKEGT